MKELLFNNREIQINSVDLAKVIGKSHHHILRDIRNEINNLGPEIGLTIFGESSYLNTQNKEQPCYVFGRKGAMQLALKYDATTRYKVIEKIESLEKGLATPEELIVAQAKSIIAFKAEVNGKLLTIEDKMDKLEDEAYITPLQRNEIRRLRNKKVISLLGGKKSVGYQNSSFRSRVYSNMSHQYDNYFEVCGYPYTPKVKVEEAKEFVNAYRLPTDLEMELKKLEKAQA